MVLVMPGSISSAGFHGGEDVDQPGMIASFGNDRLDSVFFAEGLVAPDELDLNTDLDGELLGMVAQLIALGFCPPGVVKQSDLVVTEVARHGAGLTDIRKGSGDDNPVKAEEHASDLILVTFNKRIRDLSLLFWLVLRIRIGYPKFFGSGYAGLGILSSV